MPCFPLRLTLGPSFLLSRCRDAHADVARCRRRGFDLAWLEADAERLPLADASVDSYTIAFGLRNVTRPENALADAARVLRPGGRLLVLEFSHVTAEPLRAAYDAYSFAAIPAIGRLVVRDVAWHAFCSTRCACVRTEHLAHRDALCAQTGDAAPYQYLVESIRQFATQEELAEMMQARTSHVLAALSAVFSSV
jgi:ubiquinone/menaquinone biosynthesis C-methylase UbiE